MSELSKVQTQCRGPFVWGEGTLCTWFSRGLQWYLQICQACVWVTVRPVLSFAVLPMCFCWSDYTALWTFPFDVLGCTALWTFPFAVLGCRGGVARLGNCRIQEAQINYGTYLPWKIIVVYLKFIVARCPVYCLAALQGPFKVGPSVEPFISQYSLCIFSF